MHGSIRRESGTVDRACRADTTLQAVAGTAQAIASLGVSQL
jgi:hypothetical protein